MFERSDRYTVTGTSGDGEWITAKTIVAKVNPFKLFRPIRCGQWITLERGAEEHSARIQRVACGMDYDTPDCPDVTVIAVTWQHEVTA